MNKLNQAIVAAAIIGITASSSVYADSIHSVLNLSRDTPATDAIDCDASLQIQPIQTIEDYTHKKLLAAVIDISIQDSTAWLNLS